MLIKLKGELMQLITIDIKSEKQSVAEAIAQFLVELDAYKKGGFKVMKVIHGYGSHGVGGAIRQAFLKKCQDPSERAGLKGLRSKIIKKIYIPFYYITYFLFCQGPIG